MTRVDRSVEPAGAADSVWSQIGTSIEAFGPGIHAESLAVGQEIERRLGPKFARQRRRGCRWPPGSTRSTRSIADRLVISPRTVDGHVERIFGKLDVTSRSQIAAWAAEHPTG